MIQSSEIFSDLALFEAKLQRFRDFRGLQRCCAQCAGNATVDHRRSQGGGGPAPLNWNDTNDKNVSENTIVSSVSFSIFAYNRTRVQQ